MGSSSTEGLPEANMKVVLLIVSIVALCHAQSLPSAPKDWPSNWVMFGHNECQASQRDVSYVLYSASGDQVRSDVNVIMDMAQNMTYYNFDTSVNKNQTVEVFVASSYAGEAKCVSEKMGENGHPGKGITPDWAAGSKWIGQSSIDEVQVNVWAGTNYAAWFSSLTGCPTNGESVFYVLYEEAEGLRRPLQMDIIAGDVKPNWDPEDIVGTIHLQRNLALRAPATNVFNFKNMMNLYCSA